MKYRDKIYSLSHRFYYHQRPPFALSMLMAALFVLIALLLKLQLIDPLTDLNLPFMVFFTAIMISSWYGGAIPGLFATFLSGIAALYYFLLPYESFTGKSMRDLVPLIFFIFEGVLISALNGVLHRVLTQVQEQSLSLAKGQEQLEVLVKERTRELTTANDALHDEIALRKDTEKALRRSNRELEEFASVASHDLQEPLRKVQAFADRLKTKFNADLKPEAIDYIDRMQNAGKRMQGLISDLLQFARVTTKATPFTAVDLNVIATEVLSDLEVKIDHLHAQVLVQTLPTVDADPLQMRQLFQNFISNSLKFHKKDLAPEITISARKNAKFIKIFFKDNGIGFDPKYGERIFQIFERLHSRDEYAGTGVGLAVCRKIVIRHEGSIKVQTEEGQGATFVVTLPITQQQI